MTEPVEAQNEVEQTQNEVVQEAEQVLEDMQADSESQQEEKQVPLTALQKERKKRQELEMKLQFLEQQAQKPAEEDDYTKYESATREDLSKSQLEAVRMVEERLWMKQNPEKYEKINEELPQLLKLKPHLAQAIAAAPNRYEEAYALMTAFTPKQREAMKSKPEPKVAPNSPTSVPKGAALDQTMDVMSMSDSDFRAWRQSLKRGR